MEILGIDIGGTGMKGALVDTKKGELKTKRFRLLTPNPATPEAMCKTLAQIVSHFGWKGRVGCGLPAVIKNGKVRFAANLSDKWIGIQAQEVFSATTGYSILMANDADLAGLAEMRFGAGRDRNGVVLIVTLGTGIGTALFMDGRLVPNTEFGHIEIRGKDAENRAAANVRGRKKMSWKKWARYVNEYLEHIELYLCPELVIVGGGVSKKYNKFLPLLTVNLEVVAAHLRNDAGIIGAALAAAERLGE
jgi:polyphosphate glucokinase